jgi:hypothetical protein
MINMALTPDEAKEEAGCMVTSSDDDTPKYPYGLSLYLNDETLQKLGMTSMPDVGTKLRLVALVDVTGNSQRQTQDGKDVSMDLQITDMELVPAQAEPSAATVLYGTGGSA